MSTDKITRTIRFRPDIDKRLVDLCNHIGTNPNAYLVTEIGKCIARDELAFVSQKNQTDFLAKIVSGFEVMQEEQADLFKDDEAK